MRLPRPPPPRDRAGTPRTRVWARPDHHGAHGGVSRVPHRRDDGGRREPERPPRSGRDLPDRGTVREDPHHGTHRVHR